MMERELDRGLRRRSERCTCLGHVLGHCPDGTIVVGPAIGTPPDQIHPTDGQPSSNLRLRILIVPRERILKVTCSRSQPCSSFSVRFQQSSRQVVVLLLCQQCLSFLEKKATKSFQMTNLKLNWQILLLATDAAKQDWTRASLATSCLCSPQTTSCTLVAKTDPYTHPPTSKRQKHGFGKGA